MDSARQSLDLRKTCDPKRHLVHSRQPSESLFVLLEGIIAREWIMDDASRQIVGLHVPGDVCGLTALSKAQADHSLIALSPVSFISVPRQSLSSFARESTELQRAVWQEFSREAAINAAWIVNLGQRSAYQRIAHLMCELDARLRAVGRDTHAGLEWPGNQADIGAATGLSLVHVNRTLRRLEAAEHVITGRRLRFRDLSRLGETVGFDPTYLTIERNTLGEMLLSHMNPRDQGRSNHVWKRPSTQDRGAAASSSRT